LYAPKTQALRYLEHVPIRSKPPGPELNSFRFGKTHRSFDRIPTDATTSQLRQLLADNWSRVCDGNLIAKGEASFLKRLASHPAADDTLRAEIATRAEGIALSDSARDAGVQDFFDSLRPPRDDEQRPSAGTSAPGMSLLDVRAGAIAPDAPPDDPPDARIPDFGRPQRQLGGVPAHLDTAQLATLFADRLPALLDGPNGAEELVMSELAWVAKLARHGSATPSLRRDIEARLRSVPMHPDAERAGGRLLLAALGEGARPVTETVMGGARRGQLSFVFGPPQYELGSVPSHYAATELGALVDRQWPMIADGDEVLSTELAWLHEVASQPGANASLRKEIARRLEPLGLHAGVSKAAYDSFVDALRTNRSISPPPRRPEPASVQLPKLNLPPADDALPKLKPDLDSAQLGFLLDDNLAKLLEGTGDGGIGAAGAAWLRALAAHPGADARLRLKIVHRVSGKFDSDANARGAVELVDALRKGGRLVEQAAPPAGTRENLPVKDVDRALTTIKDVLLGAAQPDGAVGATDVARVTQSLSEVEQRAVTGFYRALVAERPAGDLLTLTDVSDAWKRAASEVSAADGNADGLSGTELLHVGALGGAAIDLARVLAGQSVAGVVAKPDSRFNGMQNDALKSALQDHAAVRLVMGYDRARQALFSDVDNEGGVVVDVYTQRQIKTNTIPSADGPAGINTEHTRPRSRGVDHTAAQSDLHHLFPTDSVANSRRSSYPFGDVADVLWSDGDARLGYDANGRMVFEPPLAHRGNVARALFYVSSTYDLPIDDAEEAVLRRWNVDDPVDTKESVRNERVEHHQKNRNPFVDDPNLADRIDDF
jgi:endonuclease I